MKLLESSFGRQILSHPDSIVPPYRILFVGSVTISGNPAVISDRYFGG
jgi:hypothetical protein